MPLRWRGRRDVAVDHNYGGSDSLRVVDQNGSGIRGVQISAYVNEEYESFASAATRRDVANTNDAGRWIAPMFLDSGVQYLLLFEIAGRQSRSVSVTVEAPGGN